MELAKANEEGMSDDDDDDVDDARAASEHSYELYVQSGRPGDQDDNKERMSVYSGASVDPHNHLSLRHRPHMTMMMTGNEEEDDEGGGGGGDRRVRNEKRFFSSAAKKRFFFLFLLLAPPGRFPVGKKRKRKNGEKSGDHPSQSRR